MADDLPDKKGVRGARAFRGFHTTELKHPAVARRFAELIRAEAAPQPETGPGAGGPVFAEIYPVPLPAQFGAPLRLVVTASLLMFWLVFGRLVFGRA